MIPAHDDHGALLARDALDGTEKHLLRLGGGHIGIKDVPRDKNELDGAFLADAGDLLERLLLFGQTFAVHQAFADMPIGSV